MEIFGNFYSDKKSCNYKFNVYRIITWKLDVSVVRVIGEHEEGRSNADVESVKFSDFKLSQFPRNIGNYFPNLKVLTINNCTLTTVSKFDLMGLKQLKQLTLNGNSISVLPNNLFENTPALEFVSFYGNRIEFIGRNIFDSLHLLRYANLKMNLAIDVCFKDVCGISLNDLKKIIDEHCQPKLLFQIEELITNNMEASTGTVKGM
jgi:Leucine-rich repeat (LRR) protein